MSTVYRRADGAVDAVVDDQVVLLAPATMSYHSLDRVAAAIWARLAEPTSVDDLVAGLTERFDVSDEQCRADLAPFLDRMTSIGVLETVAD